MDCFSCSKQKSEIHAHKSAIIKDVTVFMCPSCIDTGYEPRWVIVLGARSQGIDSVRDYIVKRKYYGAEITAEELMS